MPFVFVIEMYEGCVWGCVLYIVLSNLRVWVGFWCVARFWLCLYLSSIREGVGSVCLCLCVYGDGGRCFSWAPYVLSCSCVPVRASGAWGNPSFVVCALVLWCSNSARVCVGLLFSGPGCALRVLVLFCRFVL